MKAQFLILFLVLSSLGYSQEPYKKPYEQPMTPAGDSSFVLDPLPGGTIKLNSNTTIKDELIVKGKTNLKSNLKVKGNTKFDGEVKFIPESNKDHISLKDWYTDSYALKNRIDNDSILGSIKGKKGLHDEIETIAKNVKNQFAEKELQPYIDFKFRKSLIGKFEGISKGVEINPIHQMANFDDYTGDISVPGNKDVFFLANMKKGDVINRVLVDGKSPEQGRKLTIFNNNSAHIGFKVGEGDGSIGFCCS